MRSIPRRLDRTDDNLALQRLVAAGYGHACLDRPSAASAIEPSPTRIEPAEILIPRTIALCLPRRRDLSGSALMLMDADPEPVRNLTLTRLAACGRTPA